MKRRALHCFVSSLAFGVIAGACTDAALKKLPPPPAPIPDDKLAVQGEVCTRDPEELVFPLRALFLVVGV